jgi:3'-phosphoadenosine 5'-phosphosulfate sulfotransferase (PAPS reductase)/FAD synthetase
MIDIVDDLRCDCIAMTRSIKDKLDTEFATMKVGEVSRYLENTFTESPKPRPGRNNNNLNIHTIQLY